MAVKSEKNCMIFNGPMNIIQKLEDLGVMASGHFAQEDTELSWVLTHAGELMIVGNGSMDLFVDDFDYRIDATDYEMHTFYYPIRCSYQWFAYHDQIRLHIRRLGLQPELKLFPIFSDILHICYFLA